MRVKLKPLLDRLPVHLVGQRCKAHVLLVLVLLATHAPSLTSVRLQDLRRVGRTVALPFQTTPLWREAEGHQDQNLTPQNAAP